MADQFEDIVLAGHTYRFVTKFDPMRFLEYQYGLDKVAKKEIYAAMLETGEVGANSPGYMMVSTKLARAWVKDNGFEAPPILKFLSEWLAEPLDNAPPLINSIVESGEVGIEVLRRFFTGLNLPTPKTEAKQANSTSSAKKAGQAKKTSSPKASQSA